MIIANKLISAEASSQSSQSSLAMTIDLRGMTDAQLVTSLKNATAREREAVLDVVRNIHEFMRRKLYLEHGCTSIFSYLVEKLGYAKSTAQNRIEAARLIDSNPTLEADLASGAINLTQITVFSQAVRQFGKEAGDAGCLSNVAKARILSDLRNQTVERSAVIVAKALDLQLKEPEKTRHQKDESVVLQVTLSKQQFEDLRRAKNLSSHIQHDANWAEVISLLARDYIGKKDLSQPKRTTAKAPAITATKATPTPNTTPNTTTNTTTNTATKDTTALALKTANENVREIVSTFENSQSLMPSLAPVESSAESKNVRAGSDPNHAVRRAIPMATKRIVAARAGAKCGYVDRSTGEICESDYLLQFDHILSVAKGGGNEADNLQMLCAIHNRRKFQREG